MSLSIDELYSLYGMYGVNGVTQTNSQSTAASETETKATEGDSYISTIAGLDPNAAIPSENYNDLALKIKSASQAAKEANSTDYASVAGTVSETDETQAVGGAGGGGGSSDSDEDDTETEVVTINGVTYLQTTTTDEDGNTTVTRVRIGTVQTADGQKAADASPSPAAQALASA
jgi:hypothetical protein